MPVSIPAGKAPTPDLESRLSASIDGELGGRAQEKFRRELEADSRLRGEFHALRDLDRLLEDRPDPGEAPDLRAAVLARVNRDLDSSVSRRGRRFASLDAGWSALWPAGWATGGAVCAMMIWAAVHSETPAVTADVTPFEDAIIAAVAADNLLSDPLAEMFGSTEGAL